MKYLLAVVLAAAVFVTAIEIVTAQHESRKLFVELQVLESVRDDMNEEWGRLQLEQSTWATDDRIESVARSGLGMDEPDESSRVLLMN